MIKERTPYIVQTNYWKELRSEINEIIGELHGLVLLTHNSIEFSDFVDFLNKVKKDEQQNILYISLVNSYKNIKTVLKEKPLINKKLYVVDCVSGFLIELQDSVDCVYRKPPENLKEMKELVLRNIRYSDPNIIVIDSLSQFINFSIPVEEDLHELYSFLKSIKEDAMSITTDTVILLYNDKMGSMKRLPTLFTNMILKLEVIKETVDWKD